LQITSGQLMALDTALQTFAENRLPFLLMRKVNRIRDEVQTYLRPWIQDIAPLIAEYGEDGAIGPQHKGWDAFQAAVAPFCSEPLTLKVEPLDDEDLRALETRDDFALPETVFRALKDFGVIVGGTK